MINLILLLINFHGCFKPWLYAVFSLKSQHDSSLLVVLTSVYLPESPGRIRFNIPSRDMKEQRAIKVNISSYVHVKWTCSTLYIQTHCAGNLHSDVSKLYSILLFLHSIDNYLFDVRINTIPDEDFQNLNLYSVQCPNKKFSHFLLVF